MTAAKAKKELKLYANSERAHHSLKFFKTGKGDYGEGDKFIGVRVPNIRKIAQIYKSLGLDEIDKLLKSKIHEERLLALIILANQFKNAIKNDDSNIQQMIYRYYIKQYDKINNWDLVDASCHIIIGGYLANKPKANAKLLYDWAKSTHLWKKRMAIISTFSFIRENNFRHTIEISSLLLNDPHDLIHKAVGWMLREVGKKDKHTLKVFLDDHAASMPRTMLRYAIEKLPDTERISYLAQGKKTAQ